MAKVSAEVIRNMKAKQKARIKKLHAEKNAGRLITKQRMIKAIEGSGGICKRIALALGVSTTTVKNKLAREDWEDVRLIYEAERDAVNDVAEQTVIELMEQRIDFTAAGLNARWWLDRKGTHRGFGEKTKVQVEGGDKPIQVRAEVEYRIEDLDLPISVKKIVLAAIKAKNEENANEEES